MYDGLIPSDVGGVDKLTEVSVVARRTLKADDVDGFMLAAWDDVVDLKRCYGVDVLVDVRWGASRGRMTLHAQAVTTLGEAAGKLVGVADMMWPTSKATSLHALLYGLLVRLERAVAESWGEEHWETGSPYAGLADRHE